MNCEKCQDLGIIERNHGLEFSFCDCEIGKAIREKKRAIYGIPEDVSINGEKPSHLIIPTPIEGKTIEETIDIARELIEVASDSDNRTKPDNTDTRSGDTSEPELRKKPKAKKRARKRAK